MKDDTAKATKATDAVMRVSTRARNFAMNSVATIATTPLGAATRPAQVAV